MIRPISTETHREIRIFKLYLPDKGLTWPYLFNKTTHIINNKKTNQSSYPIVVTTVTAKKNDWAKDQLSTLLKNKFTRCSSRFLWITYVVKFVRASTPCLFASSNETMNDSKSSSGRKKTPNWHFFFSHRNWFKPLTHGYLFRKSVLVFDISLIIICSAGRSMAENNWAPRNK